MNAVAAVFACGAVVVTALAAVGMARSTDFFVRLHYLSLASLFPPLALAVAVFASRPLSLAAVLKTILLVVIMTASGPLVIHLLARAGRRHSPSKET